MPGSKSDFLENKVLDLLFGSVAYSVPATLYFAAYTVAPTDAGGGTEVAGGGYARVAKTNNTANFPAASGGVKSNGTAIDFPAATADWGTVVAIGVLDAASGGNLLAHSTLAVNKLIQNTDQLSIPIGSFTVTED